MRSIRTIFLGIVSSILAGLLIYYFTTTTPDIKYSLLGPIPISMSNVSGTIQQLDIKNFGNQAAQDINIKIKGNNITYEIIKHSSGDIEKVFVAEEQLEIIYPQLPPEANISIIIKSRDPVSIKDISVSHQNGKAKEILSSSNHFFRDYVIIAIGYLIFSLLGLRETRISYLERTSYKWPNEILLKEKPWYLFQEKWNLIREIAIRAKVFKDSGFRNYIELEKDEKYKLLSGKKPEYLNLSEWETLLSKTRENLSDYLDFRISNAQSPQDVINLLSNQKPQHFSQSKWNDFVNDCNEKYIGLRINRIAIFPSMKDYIAEINSEKPDVILQDKWNKYLDQVKKRLASTIEYELINSKNPLEYFDKLEKEIDIEAYSSHLRNKAYRLQLSTVKPVDNINEAEEFLNKPKPGWIEERDYKAIRRNAENIVEAEKLKNQYTLLLQIFNGIIENKTIPTQKPYSVSQTDWDQLQNIDTVTATR